MISCFLEGKMRLYKLSLIIIGICLIIFISINPVTFCQTDRPTGQPTVQPHASKETADHPDDIYWSLLGSGFDSIVYALTALPRLAVLLPKKSPPGMVQPGHLSA
jgi:hypothetical protein